MLLEHRENHSGALEVQAAASLRVAQVRRVASCLATWQQQRGRPLIWVRLETPVRRDPGFVMSRSQRNLSSCGCRSAGGQSKCDVR